MTIGRYRRRGPHARGLPKPTVGVAHDPDLIALHEATHAVLALAYELGLESVTIVPDGEKVGNTRVPWGREAPADLEHVVIMYLGAAHATSRVTLQPADTQPGIEGDRAQARAVMARAGVAPELIDGYFARLSARADIAVSRHWASIVRLAGALLERHTLTGEEARAIVNDTRGQS